MRKRPELKNPGGSAEEEEPKQSERRRKARGRRFIMTEEAYQEKYHRAFVKIDLSALCDNVKNIRRLVPAQSRLMAIVKADGYGHGAVPVARAFDELSENGRPVVDAYGVAMVEEGLELRRAGVTKPILVLGHSVPEQAGEAVRSSLSLTVFDYKLAQALSREAVRQERTAQIHIKLDTGMSRIGYLGTECDIAEITQIQSLPGIELEGLFSHFAKSDETDKTAAKEQFEKFRCFSKRLSGAGIRPHIRHIANSAAIIDMPETSLDMVRAGIALYGLYPSEEVDTARLLLRPALEFKSRVSWVKEIPEGTAVGYGGTFTAERPMRLATIPVGYADGYPRALSNCGRVLIGGRTARIVGRICMDQFMADVTELPQVRPGDMVTLAGRDGEDFLPVEEPAGLAGSFHYEFVCGITKRVPRIYYKNGVPVSVRTEFPERQ